MGISREIATVPGVVVFNKGAKTMKASEALKLELNKLQTHFGHLEADKKELQERVRELESENASMKVANRTVSEANARERAAQQQLEAENAKLRERFDAFKSIVHGTLDKIGIAEHQHKQCRVRPRMAEVANEVADLRKQLAERGELGEPLTDEAFSRLDGDCWVLRYMGNINRGWHLGRKKECDPPSRWPGRSYYEWTPPTLPEPEPLPQVPTPEYFGVLRHKTLHKFAYVRSVAMTFLWCDMESYECPQNCRPSDFTLYTGQVRLPDGTVTTIEPTEELRTALGDK